MDPKKAAAEWFRDTVFKGEAIRRPPGPAVRAEPMPPAIRAARALANSGFHGWQSRESVFLKQAKLLEFCEDDYSFDCSGLVAYYPTYQSLTDRQLRAYLSWRTRLRRGELTQAPLTFAFLYIYELLNRIGVADPLEGYRKLLEFRDAYGPVDGRILPYLERWRVDYVVYYDLEPALLSDTAQAALDRCIEALSHIREREDGEILAALRQSSHWLGRSKFYAAHRADMDTVMLRVLRRVDTHCEKLKNTMPDRYFGSYNQSGAELFATAVFCDPLKRRDYTYRLDGQCVYSCKYGSWFVCRRSPSPGTRGRLDNLLKTIDAALRDALGYGHPIKVKSESKWTLRTVEEEVRLLVAEKRAAGAKTITIDYGQLSQIRRDAAVTREKLIVDEEAEPTEEAPPRPEQAPLPAAEAPDSEPPAGGEVLEPAGARLLRCLLYGGDTGWVQEEGHLLSVLVDGINEKLYDTFADSVLDDTPQVIEDYIDDLKEMIRP